MNRKRIVLGVVVSVAVVACAGDGARMASDAMIGASDVLTDAGEALTDAGERMNDAAGEVRDGFASDAHAEPRSFEGTCEPVTATQRTTWPDGRESTVTTTYWYAEITDATIDSATIRTATVIACDHETFGTPSAATCPTGATCTGEALSLESLRCQVTDAQIDTGRARAFCGVRIESTYRAADGTVTPGDAGSRWGSIRFVIDP